MARADKYPGVRLLRSSLGDSERMVGDPEVGPGQHRQINPGKSGSRQRSNTSGSFTGPGRGRRFTGRIVQLWLPPEHHNLSFLQSRASPIPDVGAHRAPDTRYLDLHDEGAKYYCPSAGGT
jgi:hypothetical protein